ncbi:hypothetical protein A3K34_02360 [candidate division WWE3 bacterium RIFOXYC1_FULL_40_10]|uniref:Endonuclease/exonuclease/phosphatase domain-containing protein n=1 Tax=candidate division WWE3 bacterium RIFOXYA2_FULL_46_9 TaxID=1802636 RepID=A0A1F4VYZ3_UNCKA|nr:MAG: hypothetical protein A3K58_02360 [candidate division WWE3 bacterium RIFOXYB1_FULL_40_22]OGC61695.1 MAG: hypothetical protein A3K37_02360 [candidate division WWE3 bacterium RIFOXYA1_FULL_40_11]OGC62320.1 MAG: hypothetical protein A2264_02010 [candidate division WWE3 bacterium RIFOXYA2_FULL_46_9]OGC64870.1 MAG: hypothetical protein A2326_01185 [candidate division WWE3 bacterium RIFOXYB2_FULL_41_6]OGC66078.1 MAG: hypothetical protein A3K34_02360 [candidate division WWE3 bacterium RIFOXYC1_
MKIISWNVRTGNKRLHRALNDILNKEPDVVCFQEWPKRRLNLLTGLNSYALHLIPDVMSDNPLKGSYICTLTKLPVVSSKTIEYATKAPASLLSKVCYEGFNKTKEVHKALVITLLYNNATFEVANFRLSCAVGPRTRQRYLDTILRTHGANKRIYCGDFNTVDGLLMKAWGWALGYKKADFLFNERGELEKKIQELNLTNPFNGMCTTFPKWSRKMQFDHILIPNELKLSEKKMLKKSMGSDHRVLVTKIEA